LSEKLATFADGNAERIKSCQLSVFIYFVYLVAAGKVGSLKRTGFVDMLAVIS